LDDSVEGLVSIMELPRAADGTELNAPYRLYNIGNNQPVELTKLIAVLEEKLGKKAVQKFLPMQPGDVSTTYADIDELSRVAGYCPHTPIDVGVERFVQGYREYYGV